MRRSFAREPGVDPEHLAEHRRERLPVAVRIAAAPPVTESHVEVAVWPEREVAPVVVRVRLIHHEDVAPCGRIRAVASHREPRDVRVAVRVRVVHVELAAPRRERQPEEPLLASERHLVGEIEDRRLDRSGRHGSPRPSPSSARRRARSRPPGPPSQAAAPATPPAPDGSEPRRGPAGRERDRRAMASMTGVEGGEEVRGASARRIPSPQATERNTTIASAEPKRLEGVTSGWYEPHCVTVPCV